jgi:hypothetical protein
MTRVAGWECAGWVATGEPCDCAFDAATNGAATEPGGASSDVTGEVLSGRIVSVSPLAILGSTGAAALGGSACAEPSAAPRCEALLATLAAAADGAAATASGAGSAAGADAAGSLEPAVFPTTAAAASAPGAGADATRGGSKVSGSTYPCGSLVTRAPKYTYGSVDSTTPLGPTVPTTDPSPTSAPRATPIEPRWTSVAVKPKDVSIDTVFPPVGTVPAKDTTPSAGASTGLPLGAPRSIPRCWPPA